ncbi:hypothetical protein EV424DRAFT_447891 [Suillus variegatus]|nr:hypothetical protein EV424DRAFT_447891 [Suillus variegatus]
MCVTFRIRTVVLTPLLSHTPNLSGFLFSWVTSADKYMTCTYKESALRVPGRSDWIVLVTASCLTRVLELRSVQVANPLICARLYMRQGQLIFYRQGFISTTR